VSIYVATSCTVWSRGIRLIIPRRLLKGFWGTYCLHRQCKNILPWWQQFYHMRWACAWCDPKASEIWILRANGYGYIEIPIDVSPHILFESVWQAVSSWVVGFIVSKHISIVVFPWVRGFAMAVLREQRVCMKFCFKLGKTAAETHHPSKETLSGCISKVAETLGSVCALPMGLLWRW
jgi:hypothetical protein